METECLNTRFPSSFQAIQRKTKKKYYWPNKILIVWNICFFNKISIKYCFNYINLFLYTTDVIDWILENLIVQTRTRRSVIKKLKELGLIFKAPTKKSNKERREKLPLEFTEEEDNILTELWKEHGETKGICFN